MDIHSIISPLLMVLTITLFCLRAHKDDEDSLMEVYFAVVVGAVLLLIGILFLHIVVFTIILNTKVNVDEYITPRSLLLILQYYFTFMYSVVVILSIRCDNK